MSKSTATLFGVLLAVSLISHIALAWPLSETASPLDPHCRDEAPAFPRANLLAAGGPPVPPSESTFALDAGSTRVQRAESSPLVRTPDAIRNAVMDTEGDCSFPERHVTVHVSLDPEGGGEVHVHPPSETVLAACIAEQIGPIATAPREAPAFVIFEHERQDSMATVSDRPPLFAEMLDSPDIDPHDVLLECRSRRDDACVLAALERIDDPDASENATHAMVMLRLGRIEEARDLCLAASPAQAHSFTEAQAALWRLDHGFPLFEAPE